MYKVYNVQICSLRVRVTNRAAYTLYNTVLGYTTRDVEKNYYADNEDAYDMFLDLNEHFNKKVEESKEEAVPEGK